MKASVSASTVPGRPPEVEELANRLWVHPASRALVDRLIRTRVTPNQISMFSVFAAGAAGASFVFLGPTWGPLVGLAALFAWHVLDGADGDLARRTGRSSAAGELIDGVCDHTSQALVYVSLGVILGRSVGQWAWLPVVAAALSHAVQANAYETGRKTYRHWVYGAAWMRQQPDTSRSLAGFANRLYLAVASVLSPHEKLVERAMNEASAEGHEAQARQLYKRYEAVLVERSGILGSTGRSLAVVLSLLVGTPVWFLLLEIIVLNGALLVILACRQRVNLEVVSALGRLRAEL